MAMQGTGHTGISNYIKGTLLPSITAIRIQNIFDYETTDLAGFPAATVTSNTNTGSFLDNSRNEHVINFIIRIFIDRNQNNFGASKAETLLKTVADQLIAAIDADNSLGGNCIYTKAFNAKYGYIDRENNNIRLVEIELECHDANTWR